MATTHFVDAGKVGVVDVLVAADSFKYIGWGTGAGMTDETDTALFIEAPEARVAGTISQETTTVTGDTYQVEGEIVATGSRDITNAGLFNASSGGTLLIKGDFDAIPLLEDDSITFTITLHVDQ